MGEHPERRLVGPVEVVEDEHEAARPCDGDQGRVDGGEQAVARAVGIPGRWRAGQRRDEAGELAGLRADGVGQRGRADRGGEAAERLRERRVGDVALGRAATGERRTAAGLHPCDELGRQAGLADARLAGDERQPSRPVARLRPCRRERPERVVAPHERGDRARAQASLRLVVGRAQRGGRRRAQLGGELAGRRRGRGAELAREAFAQPGEDPERGAGVAGLGERAHERAMRLLAERVELRAPASERQHLAGVLRGVRRPGQQRVERDRMRVAGLQHPVVLQAGEELTAADRERGVEVARRRGGVEHPHVDLDRPPEADRVACGDEIVADGGAQAPCRLAEALAGAVVEDVGPQPARERLAGVQAGMQGEPAREEPGAT